jgi:hypothetical protein
MPRDLCEILVENGTLIQKFLSETGTCHAAKYMDKCVLLCAFLQQVQI